MPKFDLEYPKCQFIGFVVGVFCAFVGMIRASLVLTTLSILILLVLTALVVVRDYHRVQKRYVVLPRGYTLEPGIEVADCLTPEDWATSFLQIMASRQVGKGRSVNYEEAHEVLTRHIRRAIRQAQSTSDRREKLEP